MVQRLLQHEVVQKSGYPVRCREHPGSQVFDAHPGGSDRAARHELRSDSPRAEHERYFERFSGILREGHAPDEAIDALREKFHHLPGGVGALPCPYCFASDRYSRLETLAFTGRLHALRCAWCRSTVVVETGV